MREAGHLVPGKPEPLPCGWPGPRKPFRILVTASRTFTDAHAVRFALEAASLDALGREVIVVHGAADGGDTLADLTAIDLGFAREPHPVTKADWVRYGNAAGPRRNAAMVALGADVCLVFAMPCRIKGCRRPRPHDSHGASDCAARAEAAGIPVRRIRP